MQTLNKTQEDLLERIHSAKEDLIFFGRDIHDTIGHAMLDIQGRTNIRSISITSVESFNQARAKIQLLTSMAYESGIFPSEDFTDDDIYMLIHNALE